MNEKIEAAKVLYRYGSRSEAQQILQHVWEASGPQSFECFLALMELWIARDRETAMLELDELCSGVGPLQDFWASLSLSERAVIYDWTGQLYLSCRQRDAAYESLSRAASLGRDTTLLWRLLGDLCLERGDLEMSLRYLKRSLQLYRQLDLEILSGRSFALGAFSGSDPLAWSHDVDDYMQILLKLTRMAKGRKNLKAARELLMEMLHQFPEEARLPKLRLMVERSIVEHSLFAPQQRKTLEMRSTSELSTL
jgi:tetratricopeptide (TPR) repeat protein